MITTPPRLRSGNPVIDVWAERMRRSLRTAMPCASNTVGISRTPQGTVHTSFAKGRRGGLVGTVAGGARMWTPYQHTPSLTKTNPDPPPALIADVTEEAARDKTADWRTIRIAQGLVNNQHPTGDGTGDYSDDYDDFPAPDPEIAALVVHRNIQLPASSTVKVWIHCAISTTDNTYEGSVLACSLKFAVNGWSIDGGDLSDYPVEPDGVDFGTPPGEFYLYLYDITTGVDSPTDDENYHKLTLPTSWSKNNFWVDEVSFGAPVCISNETLIAQRMSARAV